MKLFFYLLIIFISPFQLNIILSKLHLSLKQWSLWYTLIVQEEMEELGLKISKLFQLLLMQFQFLTIPFYSIIIINIYIGYSNVQVNHCIKERTRSFDDNFIFICKKKEGNECNRIYISKYNSLFLYIQLHTTFNMNYISLLPN